MLKEFKEFIAKGNVLDLAVGIIIGAAFTGIVDSFVKDIISPIIGIFGKANFDDLTLAIGGATLRYGAFLTNLINFLIVAFVVFLIVKAANKFKRQEEVAPTVEPPADVMLLTEIRDLLAKKA